MMLSGETKHIKRPDKDNITKIVLDAMSGVVFRDDKQACRGTTTKEYAERERVEVRIYVD